MIIAFLSLQLAAASVTGQVDSQCKEHCQILAVQGGSVKLIDEWPPGRTLILGKYIPAAQPFVPGTEAPVRSLRSSRGWRIVMSAYLDHGDDDILLHVRFFSPDGLLKTTWKSRPWLQGADIGRLFGTDDELVVFTTTEEHAYNDQTLVWLLAPQASPKLILDLPGTYKGSSRGGSGKPPGMTFSRETYDGVHSETKGIRDEFWKWDTQTKHLLMEK
jgi:hypothetical protein